MAQNKNKKIKYTTMTAKALAEKINEELKTNDSIVIENVLIPSKMEHGTKFIDYFKNFTSYYIEVKEFDIDKKDDAHKTKHVTFKNCKLRDAALVFSSYHAHNELYVSYTDCEVQHFDVRIGLGMRNINFSNCKVQNCCYCNAADQRISRTYINAFDNTVFEYCVFAGFDAKFFIQHECEKFVNCEFRNCDFVDADLSKSTFINCKCDVLTKGFQLACPEKGEYTAYKKAKICVYDKSGKNATSDMMNGKYKHDTHAEYVIVELRIPKDAKRSSATTRKCRASKAVVLSITSIDGKKHYKIAFAGYNSNFFYKVGETVVPTNGYEENRWIECAAGIHHFITRDEAVAYDL